MNIISRIGKIARLPHSLREQLNLKLHDGLPAKSILPWLNSLPEVKAILATDFDNRPISKQNLSEWKQGGHRDWLLQYHAAHFLQFIEPCSRRGDEAGKDTIVSEQSQDSLQEITKHGPRNTDDLTQHAPVLRSAFGEGGTRITDPAPDHPASSIDYPVSVSSLTSKLLLWTQLQYTSMARYIDSETDPDRKWNALRHFSLDIARLRRSTLADDYLHIQRDWLALSQSNSIEKKELEFCKWIKRPDIADALKNKKRGLTRELLRKIEEDDLYLTGPDKHGLDEHISDVRMAKELMARRKAKEAEAKPQAAGGSAPSTPEPPPRISTIGMPFDELFPTIPEKPLTETHPELDDLEPAKPQSQSLASPGPASDPSDPSYRSDQPTLHSAFDEGGSDPVQPSPTESNQIQPGHPLDPQPNPNNDNPTPDPEHFNDSTF